MPFYHVQIAQLKMKGVSSNRKIAEILRISRNTVNSVVRQIDDANLSFQEVALMDEESAKTIFRICHSQHRLPDYAVPDYSVN